ncbi:sigma 54-interacting transcriptional regulator [Enterococcus devriesei]|uniref:sigma 54-interacting transcriptional regulator n=1 Tax=Enterococcus devriesei TaxID=319970 RepID=UPI002891E720|nr:sigma 54-interacting transcriptional regulator [Enterococcus devriesei]MDT2822997.1 sigma 54-interacting transcriptional regulator [Enterococcus devriesei]
MEKLKSEIYEFVLENSESKKKWSRNTAKIISETLKVSRNIVSQYLNEFVKDGQFGKVNSRPVIFFSFPEKTSGQNTFSTIDDAEKWYDNFFNFGLEQVVGSKGSLRNIITQMKAAIYYPPNGLPILLHGETGTGKSYLASYVYKDLIANKFLDEEACFISVNCSEYANNPELFLANFFGYVKGAYTGAENDRKGIAELANKGVLFLDEIHALSSECQEKLFQFMDNGKFHRMGDNENWYTSNCWLIFATSELPEEKLLSTLLRRIPVKLTLPPLDSRSLYERKQLIRIFIKEEAKRIKKQIVLSQQLVNFLLNYRFTGNVGNLKNIIQLACANAFSSSEGSEELAIQMYHLPQWINLNGMKTLSRNIESKFIGMDDLEKVDESFNVNELIDSLYQRWTDKKDIQSLFEEYDKYFRQKNVDVQRDAALTYPTYQEIRFRQYIKELERDFQIEVDYYYLQIISVFLNAWIHQTHVPFNEEMLIFSNSIKGSCSKELHLVNRFVQTGDIHLSEVHKLILVILFKLMCNKEFQQKRLALILAHGDLTATSIASTANRLIGKYMFDAIDMPLTTSSSEIAEKINKYLNERTGYEEIILLVDMGSLESIYQNLELDSQKKLGLLNNVSTRMAIDVANQLLLNLPLKQILEQVKENQSIDYIYEASSLKQDMIVCSCASGLGTSFKLKKILEDSFPIATNLVIETCDYYSLVNENYLEKLRKENNILFIVGTLNPQLQDVEFFSIEELILGVNIGKFSNQLNRHFSDNELELLNDNILKNFSLTNLMEQLTILNPTKLLEQVSDAIYILQNSLGVSLDNNTCFGLYVHISCLIERLVKQNTLEDEIDMNDTTEDFDEFQNYFKQSFSVVEHYYSVDIPPYEVKYVYDYVKRA